MGPGTGPIRRFVIALAGALAIAATALATEPRPSNSQAIERFRAAAVLQERALYDLAAAEYATIVRDFAADPMAEWAALQRGVCLFQLEDFAGAAAALEPLATHEHTWSPAESEQSLAYLGLAKFNLAHAAAPPERDRLLDEAIAALNKQLADHPDGPLATQTAFYLAESLYARGRLEEAVAAYRSLLLKHPDHPQRADAVYGLAIAEQERQHFAAALQAFADFEQKFPEHPAIADARARHADALLSLAESQFAAGDAPAARQTAEKLRADFFESALVPSALVLVAQVQFNVQELAAAEKTLDECIARSTHAEVTNDARLLRGEIRFQRGDFANARADAVAVLASDSNRAGAVHLRGRCDASLKHASEAVESFQELLARFPEYAHRDRVFYDLAWAQQESGGAEAATATFAKLVELYPSSELAPECHFRLGESHYTNRDFSKAANHLALAAASAKSPELVDRSFHKLAWCSFERGQFTAAEAAFARQLAAHHERNQVAGAAVDSKSPLEPLAADALWMIVECRFQLHDYERTLQAFDEALAHSAANESLRAMVCLHTAQSAAQLKQWERTRELADRTLRDFPNSLHAIEARYERGNALRELGRLDEAEQELTTLAEAHQGVVQLKAELALGKIQLARNDYDAAVRTFFKVAYGHGGQAAPVQYHPLQAEAVFAAAGALEQSGRRDAAEKLYRELVDVYPASAESTAARTSLDRILRH